MAVQPYGGLVIPDGGIVTQALTTTAGQIVAWAANGSSDSNTRYGDYAVIPDFANNRIKLNQAGAYLLDIDLTLTGGGTQDVVVQVRKNNVLVADLSARIGVTASGRYLVGFTGILTINPGDIPKTLPTMPAASTTGFVGASGAPLTECSVDVTLRTVASTVTVTLEAGHFTLCRLDG